MTDHSLLSLDEEDLDDYYEEDWDDIEERYYQAEIDDGESGSEHMALSRRTSKCGRAEAPTPSTLTR
jgi:hypothetical protein